MGLDVHLYKYLVDPDIVEQKSEECAERCNALYTEVENYDNLSEEQKENIYRANQKIEAEYNIENMRENIDLYSELYPEHGYRIGYFRSSYNSGGLNVVLREIIGRDLYDIFDACDYIVRVDWRKAKTNAREMVGALTDKIQKGDVFRTMTVDTKKDKLFSKEEALEVFCQEYEDKHNRTYNYSSNNGRFFMHSPVQIYAAIPGSGYFGNVIHLIYRVDKEDLEYYRQALEIVEETIDYVLKQPDPENYLLHWSS